MNESIARIERVTAALGPLSKDVVFVGGAVVRLLVTDPSITEFRTTDDVDVIVEITSRGAFAEFEDQLREIGFRNVTYPGAPLCRWDVDGTTVDVISVVDGRPDLPEEFLTAAASVQTFIRQALIILIATVGFRNAVLGYLPLSPAAQQRYTTIMQRFQTITQEHP